MDLRQILRLPGGARVLVLGDAELVPDRDLRVVRVGRGRRLHADPAAPPVRPGTFDAAFLSDLLQPGGDPEAVLEEAVRAVRTGGSVVVRQDLPGDRSGARRSIEALCAHFAGEGLSIEEHVTEDVGGAPVSIWVLRVGAPEPSPGGDR